MTNSSSPGAEQPHEPYKQVEPSRAREGKEPKEEVSRLLCTPSDCSGTASGQGAHEKLPAPGALQIFSSSRLAESFVSFFVKS